MAETDVDGALRRLVPLAAAGDQRALQQVIRLIHPQVLRYTRARISGGRTPTAEDVAQEVCLAVATSIHKFQDMGKPFMAFVYGLSLIHISEPTRPY